MTVTNINYPSNHKTAVEHCSATSDASYPITVSFACNPNINVNINVTFYCNASATYVQIANALVGLCDASLSLRKLLPQSVISQNNQNIVYWLKFDSEGTISPTNNQLSLKFAYGSGSTWSCTWPGI